MKIKNRDFVLTISYGDYTKGVGGTDKVILSQQKIFNNANISNLHIYPASKIVEKKPAIYLWGLMIDGKDSGVFLTEQIIRLLKKLCNSGRYLNAIIIHHFQGTEISEIDKLLAGVKVRTYLYLHDYMTICPYGGLIYNKEKFCGSEKPNNKKCVGCNAYSQDAIKREEQIETLLLQLRNRITVISPSHIAAEIWLKCYKSYTENIKVLYHQKLNGKYEGKNQQIPNDRKLRIAFVGYQSDLKGWPQWIDAVEQSRNAGCNYEFYQFGTVNQHFDYIKEVQVDFKRSLSSMTDALREYDIDCAVLWSIWPETYSYTYYEAYASNCFVITNSLSGNIAFQVSKNKNGIVCNTINLADFLLNEEGLRKAVNEYRIRGDYGPEKLVDNPGIVDLIIDNIDCEIWDKKRTDIKRLWYSLYYNVYKALACKYEQLRITLYKYYHMILDKINRQIYDDEIKIAKK